MAGGGPGCQGGKVLLWHWPCGGDIEGSDGGFKLTAHVLYHLPRLPPWISGGSRHRCRHP